MVAPVWKVVVEVVAETLPILIVKPFNVRGSPVAVPTSKPSEAIELPAERPSAVSSVARIMYC